MKPHSSTGNIRAACFVFIATLSRFGDALAAEENNQDVPLQKTVKGKLIDPLASNVTQRPVVEINPDGSKGAIPITKDTSLYGQKDSSAKEGGETKVYFGIDIKTK